MVFERRRGTPLGGEFKCEGADCDNWGTATDEDAFEPEEPVVEGEKKVESEKPNVLEDGVNTNKESVTSQVEEKVFEDHSDSNEELKHSDFCLSSSCGRIGFL